MSKSDKRTVILNEDELRKTLYRLSYEIIEKISNLDNLLLIGIPTRGIHLAEVMRKEIVTKTGVNVKKGIIDPTFYRDDQSKVGTRLIKATEIPTSIEKKEIVLIDDVIFTGRTIRAAIDSLLSWGRPQKIMLLVMIDRGNRELPIPVSYTHLTLPTKRIV